MKRGGEQANETGSTGPQRGEEQNTAWEGWGRVNSAQGEWAGSSTEGGAGRCHGSRKLLKAILIPRGQVIVKMRTGALDFSLKAHLKVLPALTVISSDQMDSDSVFFIPWLPYYDSSGKTFTFA